MGPLPPEELLNWRGLYLKRGCTTNTRFHKTKKHTEALPRASFGDVGAQLNLHSRARARLRALARKLGFRTHAPQALHWAAVGEARISCVLVPDTAKLHISHPRSNIEHVVIFLLACWHFWPLETGTLTNCKSNKNIWYRRRKHRTTVMVPEHKSKLQFLNRAILTWCTGPVFLRGG